jgi:tRNA (guanine-N7-)-methyltransferase
MEWPANWRTVFGREAPLIAEVGFGNGRFLSAQAQQKPEANFLGIEIATPSLRRTAKRLRAAGVSNVRLVKGTAQSVLQVLCAPGSIHGVVINHPDPWPKVGHHHRRLISESFLGLLASRMVVGAKLDIATDHDEYGAWIAVHLEASPYFRSRLATGYVHEDPVRVQTKYEQKGLAAGGRNYYFKWQRSSQLAPDKYPLIQELPMPHVVVASPLTLEQIAEGFEPWQRSSDEASVRFIDLYQSRRRPSLIIDTYVSEQPMEQRMMTEIYHRLDGDFLLRVQATGFPRATVGVHLAMAYVADWFCGLHPEATVVRHNLQVPIVSKRMTDG